MSAKFEVVSRFADDAIALPTRGTFYSAGYDFEVAEDVIIDPIEDLCAEILHTYTGGSGVYHIEPVNLDEMAKLTKTARPTLVATGIKCQLDSDQYLELSVRSSCPLKYWLILANGVGIIDADYYNNPDNEGEIFFQVINLSPLPIYLKKGDRIGQGIIKHFDRAINDKVREVNRLGGFGSTNG
jgi:dUTP pyrophosphatase